MTDDPQAMRQEAPYPTALRDLVAKVSYKKGWRFWLEDLDRGQGSQGLTLVINLETPDSYQPQNTIQVSHYMPVPPAAYDERSWRRWLFDQILLVERHEACEFFRLGGQHEMDERPYAPHHQPGHDPYTVYEYGSWEEVDTDFRGNRIHSDAAPPEPDQLSSTDGVV